VPAAEIQAADGCNLRPGRYLQTLSGSGHVRTAPFADLFDLVKETVALDDETIYNLTVKLYGKGAVLRRQVRGVEIKTRRQAVARTGDLIVSKIDARNGALAIIPDELDRALASLDFPLLRPKGGEVNRTLLRYCLEFGPYAKMLEALAQGTTNRQRVTAGDILELPYPLLSADEVAAALQRLEQHERVLRMAEMLSEDYKKMDWTAFPTKRGFGWGKRRPAASSSRAANTNGWSGIPRRTTRSASTWVRWG